MRASEGTWCGQAIGRCVNAALVVAVIAAAAADLKTWWVFSTIAAAAVADRFRSVSGLFKWQTRRWMP